MDRRGYRTRMVNQWLSHDIGRRLVVCDILSYIQAGAVYYTTRTRTDTRDDFCMDGPAVLSFSVGDRRCNHSCVFNDNTGLWRIYIGTKCTVHAEHIHCFLHYISY